MKKILALVLFFAALLSFNNTYAIVLEGRVLYDTLLTPVSGGYVKAMKLNGNFTLTVDSASVDANGFYSFPNITAGQSVYLIAYASTLLDFMPGYYPATQNWTTATVINTNKSQNNLDIKVRKLYNSVNPGIISGTISYSNGIPLKDAIVYLKTQIGGMVSYAITKADGSYSIPNVAEGEYSVAANRIGFNNNSVFGIILDYDFGTELHDINFSMQATVSINQISSNVPADFNLYQNYPNPFNPATKIKFDLKKSEAVKINVYDLQGKLVKELVNRVLPAGSFEVNFDGKELSSGLYIYRMETTGAIITKKMSLVK